MKPLARRDKIALAILVVGAFALRAGFVLGHRGDILFDYPVVDEETYVRMARALAKGLHSEPRPYLQPPGLVYALALVFGVVGPGLLAPRLVQAAVSALSCLLAFAVADRLFARRIAWGATVVCALHGVLVFESYELLPPTWVVAADLLMLWLLLRAIEKGTEESSFLAGIGIGVSAVFAPVVLPFAAVAAVGLRRATLIAALLAGVVLPIAPVAWRNWGYGHELVPVSTNGGINFYLGNNPAYHDTLGIRPGRRWEELMDEPRHAGVFTSGAASTYFLRKGLSFYLDHPLQAAGWYARKLVLYFHGAEIPRDTDIYAARADSWLLKLLVWRGPPAWPDGILVPLALVGAVASWRRRRELLVPYGFMAAQAVVLAAFFITSRYRAPALPVFAMFAGAGVVSIHAAWKQGVGWKRAAPGVALVALVGALNVPVREAAVSFAAEQDFYRGLALLRYRNDPAMAVERFRAATAADPSDGRMWFELGNALQAAGRPKEAAEAWNEAGEVDPWDSRARRNAAVALRKVGDLQGAMASLEANIAAAQHPKAAYASDHLNLALLRAMAGQGRGAADELRAAEQADPVYFRMQVVGFAKGAWDAATTGGAEFWLVLGDEVDKAGEAELARACWERGASTNAQGPAAAELRGRLKE